MPPFTPQFPSHQELVAWGINNQTYPMANPAQTPVEYHRLQIEYWLWRHRDLFASLSRLGPIIDVGAEYDHAFIPGLIQTNNHAYITPSGYSDVKPAVVLDVQNLPFDNNSLGAVLCMETLEHVPEPGRAVKEMRRVLKKGGWLLASTPFFWPEHGGPDYQDYWRISRDGWLHLLQAAGFDLDVCTVTATQNRDDSLLPLTIFAQKEVMELGPIDDPSRYTPGYLVRAIA